MNRGAKERVEYGDFQTPLPLARRVVARMARRYGEPGSILEPTCGVGAFIQASAERFPSARLRGYELRAEALEEAARRLGDAGMNAHLERADLFRQDWRRVVRDMPGPVWVVGNPPWVTSQALSRLASDNRPPRKRPAHVRGLGAITGESNFDVSEWALLRLVEALRGEGVEGRVAFLIKEEVARRFLIHVAEGRASAAELELCRIDARRAFGVSVRACALSLRVVPERGREPFCALFTDLDSEVSEAVLGVQRGLVVNDLTRHRRVASYLGDRRLPMRSGVKHDCAAVLELEEREHGLSNGAGEVVDVEAEMVHPLLKGGDLRRGRSTPRRALLLPQRRIGERTDDLRERAPRAHRYLCRHGERLDRRASRIYHGRPRFSVFGIGPYSFAPYKVAFAGLGPWRPPIFVPPHLGRPVLFDDTCYFLSFEAEAPARAAVALFATSAAAALVSSLSSPNAKRPLPMRALTRIDLSALARDARVYGWLAREHEQGLIALEEELVSSSGRRHPFQER